MQTRVTEVFAEEARSASPDELKSIARQKEFQIKKLVELTRIVPNLNQEMLATATQLAGELVLAETELNNARYKVQDIKANLARLIR